MLSEKTSVEEKPSWTGTPANCADGSSSKVRCGQRDWRICWPFTVPLIVK